MDGPPVMMIGPSAPNGPPVPMEMADESGFKTATFAYMRLRPKRIASPNAAESMPSAMSTALTASRV